MNSHSERLASKICITKTFYNNRLSLPRLVLEKLDWMVEYIAQNPPINPYSVKLHDYDNIYRVRITRAYRLVYKFETEIIKLLCILPRRDVYGDGTIETASNQPTLMEEILGLPEAEIEEQQEKNAGIFSKKQLHLWNIPEEYHEELLKIENEDAILNLENIPDVYLERIIDNRFTDEDFDRSLKRKLSEAASYEVENLQDLTRIDKKISSFLLQLSEKQKNILQSSYNSALLVKGGPGTGKSIIALYKVKQLTENKSRVKKILFTTYSEKLINHSRSLLEDLITEYPISNSYPESAGVEVNSVRNLALRYYREVYGEPHLADSKIALFFVESAIESEKDNLINYSNLVELGYKYWLEEIFLVIEARGIASEDEYKEIDRFGRKYALRKNERKDVWKVYQKWCYLLRESGFITEGQVIFQALEIIREKAEKPYQAVIIDEAQDLSPIALKFLVALTNCHENLYLTADVQQSLYQRSFSWNYIQNTINVPGETITLRRSFRCTRQISQGIFSILRTNTVPEWSNVRGLKPKIIFTDDLVTQGEKIKAFFESSKAEYGIPLCPGAGVILTPDNDYGKIIQRQLIFCGLKGIKVLNINKIKGLEFPFVVVVGLKTGLLPKYEETVSVEKEELIKQQRQAFYVACSRAMRSLLVIASKSYPSVFAEELKKVGDEWDKEEV